MSKITEVPADINTQVFCSTFSLSPVCYLGVRSPSSSRAAIDRGPGTPQKEMEWHSPQGCPGEKGAEPLKRFRVGSGLLILIPFPGTHEEAVLRFKSGAFWNLLEIAVISRSQSSTSELHESYDSNLVFP